MDVSTPRHLQALARSRRLALGLSQADVAARAEVSRKWVSDFERGEMPGAPLSLVLRLLEVLGIALEARTGDDAPAPPHAADPPDDVVDLDDLLAGYEDR